MNNLTNKLKLQKGQSGFTIIEVLIVLAIGALIILAVLLAVPALQNNQRNSQRKSEASRIAAAAVQYYSDANSTWPSDAAGRTTAKTQIGQIATISGNKQITAVDVKAAADLPDSPELTSNATATVYTGAKCTGTKPVAGTATQAVVIYGNFGSGTTISSCIQAQ